MGSVSEEKETRMSLLKWTDSLSVGVSDLDLQHQQLVRMINTLHESMAEGHGNLALSQTIEGLINYTQTHFATEETYFARHGYPHAGAHQAQHQAFVAQVQDFKNGFDGGELFLSIDVMDFLSSWLVEHIQGSDKEYGPFLNERGVM
jgi:hemerythrin